MTRAGSLTLGLLALGLLALPAPGAAIDSVDGPGVYYFGDTWTTDQDDRGDTITVILVTGPSPNQLGNSSSGIFWTTTYSNSSQQTTKTDAEGGNGNVSETVSSTAATPDASYDAFINMGRGTYAAENSLTVGGARPWYTSPVVTKLFHGVPDAAQRADFTSTVLTRASEVFARSGLGKPVTLTTDPDAEAAHEMSVVSGTHYGPNKDAIGITNMRGDGFSFIDKLTYAKSVDELGWAVAHNVAHELAHAFGVEHFDETGKFLDSAVTPWEVLIDPNSVFGPEAVEALMAANLRDRYDSVRGLMARGQGLDSHGPQCQCLAHQISFQANPVPEPTTWALWGVAATAGLIVRHRRCQARRMAA